MNKNTAVYAYHIASEGPNGQPVTRDKRLVVVGEKLVHAGTPVICQEGYHASRRVIDCAGYSPTTGEPWLCIVKLKGVTEEHNDKLVAKERTVLAMAKATDMFIECAKQSAAKAEEWATTDKPPTSDEAAKILADIFQAEADKLLGTIEQAKKAARKNKAAK